MLNPLAILPGVVLFVYYVAVLLINSGIYNTWSREVVPLTERLSEVFPRLLPWDSLVRFKVRPDIVFPYMDPQNDFVYFPERMLMYNNVWNLNLISRAVGEALQMRSSFWHVYHSAKPVLRWIFLVGIFGSLLSGATKILYFFAVLGVLLDYMSYVFSADALNRSKLVLVQYSPEVADFIRLLPPSFVFEALGEPYRILRYVVFHMRWGNL
ncbi:MAG TPA: hypothetical protein GX508_01170 [Coprothermobacter sp.]|mgnify:FL=1|nr:hypothetical protein [Coprothermobacter sp.]